MMPKAWWSWVRYMYEPEHYSCRYPWQHREQQPPGTVTLTESHWRYLTPCILTITNRGEGGEGEKAQTQIMANCMFLNSWQAKHVSTKTLQYGTPQSMVALKCC